MTSLVVHQCPKCELRFSFRSELEYHLSADHPVPASLARTRTQVDEAPAPEPQSARPLDVPPVAAVRYGSARWQPRVFGLLFAFAAVLLVVYAALFATASAAVIVAAVVATLVAIYVRRSRGWPRLPRR